MEPNNSTINNNPPATTPNFQQPTNSMPGTAQSSSVMPLNETPQQSPAVSQPYIMNRPMEQKILPKVQTLREKFILAVNWVLLVVCAIELYCWINAELSAPSTSVSGASPVFIGMLLLICVNLPFLIISIVAIIYAVVKSAMASAQPENRERVLTLSAGTFITIVVAPVFIIISVVVNNFWPIIFAPGVSFIALLVSNIAYAQKLKADRNRILQQIASARNG